MILILPLEKKDCSNIIEWNKDKDADFLMQWAGQYYTYPITEEQTKSMRKRYSCFL